ncbi:MAG: hypothetical protein IT285_00775 [Bdellovibrionales bacterium]|nr:hypothetical protein [Bdellovibrionales bacterium]
MSGADQSELLGVVIVRLAPGWRAQLSARADAPLALGACLKRISDEDLSVSRTVVFLNVIPGRHLLTLQNPATGESGAAAIPVLGGAATALPEMKAERIRVSGWLLQAEAIEPQGAEGVHVRVIGQTGRGASTSRNGGFSIMGAVRVSGMPAFLEAEGPDGFKHRFIVSPGEEMGRNWYYFSRASVERWIGSVPGGISDGSGLVVGAFPGLARRPGSTVKAALHPLLADVPHLPEVYGIGPTGSLEAQDGLTAESPRFVGLQVPEGFVKAQITDESGTAYSELLPISRDVVHVLGPY